MIAIEEATSVRADGTLVLCRPEFKAGEQVKVILLLGGEARPQQQAPSTGRKLKQDWAGGLAEMAGEYTSVELQHEASDWRRD